jgi:hypothetical protein
MIVYDVNISHLAAVSIVPFGFRKAYTFLLICFYFVTIYKLRFHSGVVKNVRNTF